VHTGIWATVHAMHQGITRQLVYDYPDVVNSGDTAISNIMVQAQSCWYPEFDLKKQWLTLPRWNNVVRQYVDRVRLDKWLDFIKLKLDGPRKRGVAHMRSKDALSYANLNGREWRQWGSCMLGWSFQRRPTAQITMHSRTSYLGYMAPLDLAVSVLLAEEIAAVLEMPASDISLVWVCDLAQFHAFKGIAWFYQDDSDLDELRRARWESYADLRETRPTLAMVVKAVNGYVQDDKTNKGYGDHAYEQQLRIRRRWHAETKPPGYGKKFEHGATGRVKPEHARAFGPLPSYPLEALDLSAAKLPALMGKAERLELVREEVGDEDDY
jgi:hypothetical protein